MTKKYMRVLLMVHVVFLSACTTVSESHNSSLIGEWHIASINNSSVHESSSASLRFNKSSRLSGNASCNNISTSYTLTNNSIAIGNAATTRMMCSPSKMTQEQQFLKLLPKVVFWSIQGKTLTLKNQDNIPIIVATKTTQ